MRPARRTPAIAVLGVMLAAEPSRAQEASYVISNYELTFQLDDERSDAHVTMDITYRIESGTKSDGFKYIGNFEPSNLSGTEVDGPPLRLNVEHQRETRIVWRVTPTGRGEKRVRIDFTISGAIGGSLVENTLRTDWAGVFRVPIERAVYRVVLPLGWTGERITTTPEGFTRGTVDGRPAIEVEQQPLRETSFVVTFGPGLVDRPVALLAAGPRSRSNGSGSVFPFVPLIMVAVLLLFVIAAARAKRGKRGSDGSWTSSCAGGSSCSSGCGGGGCGGGCGS